MNPPVEGVVTHAWSYVIASYGLLWVTLALYGGWFGNAARKLDATPGDRVATAAIAGGAAWVLLGAVIAGYDYHAGLALPKALLYAWATPGMLAVSYGIVRQT